MGLDFSFFIYFVISTSSERNSNCKSNATDMSSSYFCLGNGAACALRGVGAAANNFRAHLALLLQFTS